MPYGVEILFWLLLFGQWDVVAGMMNSCACNYTEPHKGGGCYTLSFSVALANFKSCDCKGLNSQP